MRYLIINKKQDATEVLFMKTKNVKKFLACALAVSMMAGTPMMVSADQLPIVSMEVREKKPNGLCCYKPAP